MLNPYFKFFYKSGVKLRGNISDFDIFDADYCSKILVSKNPDFWQKKGEEMALSLFKAASTKVPAYKDFLKKNKINTDKIKNIGDFSKVPQTNKENYLKFYPLQELCWDGVLEKNTLLSVSSGSSGKPFFWPRGNNLELETSILHELMLKDIFEADERSTLFIITFSMGIYIAGVITLNSVLRTAQKSYPVTCIAPGINIDETLRIVGEMSPKFSQTIIAGYPPFIKDIIERGRDEGIDWEKIKIKFLFATESFSESWRDFILKKVGAKDALKTSCNIYGSADAGILGHETPLSIKIRRKDDRLLDYTLVQYNPLLKYYEEAGEELVFSAYGGIPLIRYNIGDRGNVYSYEKMAQAPSKSDWKLPFLRVLGKSGQTTSLYGVKIYPEHIKAVLSGNNALLKFITGKFVLERKYKNNQDQYLAIHIEMRKNVKGLLSLKDDIQKKIIGALKKYNLEYNRLYQSIQEKAKPIIILQPNNYRRYFDPNAIKHRWKIN
ncbi:MAG: phenylacetate--CoA ligase family protein [Candidatus Nealsonbacteria bacterium]|nr:phenylacetate--CoA ligase family protein [Candidatus Nealsonbacteria bacterium]